MTNSANLDLVRSIFAGFERGDFSSADWAHPNIELVFPDGPQPGSWRGLAGLADGTRDLLDAWEGYCVEADEYRELDAERILVLVRMGGRGKHSRVDLGELQSKGAALFQVRDGKITKHIVYFDRERAFADLGLPPKRDSP